MSRIWVRSLETKKEIRNRIRTLRAALPERERHQYSGLILERLLGHPLYQQADEIYCYVSFGEEVDTSGILEHVWKSGRRLAVPKILPAGDSPRQMEFFYIESTADLKKGCFGIPEPATDRLAGCEGQGKNVLVIMPGVAFDTQLGRIGYGKGFYDTYLRRHPDYRTIALAYSMQCLEYVPTEEHDVRPEMILTEKEVYTC